MRKNPARFAPWAAALALVLVGLAAPASRAGGHQGQPIYAQNNTDRPIWVAARYIPAGCRRYVTDGYWRIEPGQRVLILYNNGVWAYFHARDAQGRVSRGRGAPIRATVRGDTVDMYPEDTGTDYNPRVITFFFR
jgi:hypothetical protein